MHERGYSRLKRSGVLESGGEKAESSDVTDLHSLEQLIDPQQRCRGPRGWSLDTFLVAAAFDWVVRE